MTNKWDVIVVGAGLAGLAAGATAASAGASVLVLEAHQPGGRARVSGREGFVFNHGAHALYLGGAGAAVLSQLGVRPEGEAPPLSRYMASRGGRLYALPSGPGRLAATKLLGRRDKARFAMITASVLRADASRYAGVAMSDWIADRAGDGVLAELLAATTRIGTYSGDLSDLDAGAAIRQVQIGLRPGVAYLHGGWGPLVSALTALCQVRPVVAVRSLTPAAGAVEVETDDGVLAGSSVVVATGAPAAARQLLPEAPPWGDLGRPVTAACLDLGLASVPSPGWVLGIDEPLYCTLQSPPARQAPPGGAVVGVLRYGARAADADRVDLERYARLAGADPSSAVVRRFLARMTVAGAQPRAANGGLAGRPPVTATGYPSVFLAGDWVGPEGLLADAALASGAAAARAALGVRPGATMVA